MKDWHTVVFALIIAAGFTTACSTSPTDRTSTQTGRIQDVKIGDTISPKEIVVYRGDEVRFVNARNAPVRVQFVEPLKESIGCQNGFVTSRFSEEGRNINVTTIKQNKFASLCFLNPGIYHYNARMEAPVAGGEVDEPGQVRVE